MSTGSRATPRPAAAALLLLLFLISNAGCRRSEPGIPSPSGGTESAKPAPAAQAIKVAPADAEAARAAVLRGRQLFAARDFAGARATFAEAVKLDPGSADAWFWAGRADIASSAGMSYSRAIEFFRTALALDAKLAQAHWGLGIARYSLSDYDGGERDLRAYLAAATDAEPTVMRAEAHHFLGLIAGTAGRNEAALAEFAAAARLNPAWADVPFERGRILEALHRDDEALAAYRDATRLEPNHLPAHFRLARLLRAAGQIEAATREERIHRVLNTLTDNLTGKEARTPAQRLALYGELAQLDPTNRVARLEYARALSEQQRTDEAELALDDLLKEAPDYLDGCVLRATLALRGGKKGDAARVVAAFAKAAPAATATLPAELQALLPKR